MASASFKIATALARRMRAYRELAASAQKQGDESIHLDLDEFWTVEDEAALSAFENFALEQSGVQPLFTE